MNWWRVSSSARAEDGGVEGLVAGEGGVAGVEELGRPGSMPSSKAKTFTIS